MRKIYLVFLMIVAIIMANKAVMATTFHTVIIKEKEKITVYSSDNENFTDGSIDGFSKHEIDSITIHDLANLGVPPHIKVKLIKNDYVIYDNYSEKIETENYELKKKLEEAKVIYNNFWILWIGTLVITMSAIFFLLLKKK